MTTLAARRRGQENRDLAMLKKSDDRVPASFIWGMNLLGAIRFMMIGACLLELYQLLFKGKDGAQFVIEGLMPTVNTYIVVAFFPLLLISLLLLVHRRVWVFSGLGFLLLDYLVLFGLWLWACAIAFALAGSFWTVTGVCVGGITVILVALIASLVHGEWYIAMQIIIYSLVCGAFRQVGFHLIKRGCEFLAPQLEENSEYAVSGLERGDYDEEPDSL